MVVDKWVKVTWSWRLHVCGRSEVLSWFLDQAFNLDSWLSVEFWEFYHMALCPIFSEDGDTIYIDMILAIAPDLLIVFVNLLVKTTYPES